jgi:hypothetical protein
MVAYTVANAPKPSANGVLLITLPGTWLLMLTIGGFIAGGLWQFRRERRRIRRMSAG